MKTIILYYLVIQATHSAGLTVVPEPYINEDTCKYEAATMANSRKLSLQGVYCLKVETRDALAEENQSKGKTK